MDNWYVPITLLPSVGFFIVATTSVSNALSAEIARLIELDRKSDLAIIPQKIRQLRLANISLVLMYASAVFLSVAGLVAGLQVNFMIHMKLYVEVLVCIGIAAVIGALIVLMIYSMRAVRIKENQFNNM